MSLKDTILAAEDIKLKAIEVPEWGTTVYIRVMSGTERDSWETNVLSKQVNIRAGLLVRCLADDQGKRIFSDSDVNALGAKSGHVLDKLFELASKHNRLKREDVEELEKN
jgi:hypothetical protein